MVVIWCPDWPVVAASAAAGLPPHVPVAAVAAKRVLACSAVARANGVRRDLRRREAQSRCPELVVFPWDADRDARLFEPVAAAIEELAPRVEVVRPGLVAVPASGPTSYFGGAEATAERLVDQVASKTGVECQVGVADGLFAAVLAAHRGIIVPVGASPGFLAPLSITELAIQAGPTALARTELINLLRRLGLRTLGAFAELPERDVASRFGVEAVYAHRLASGCFGRPLNRRCPAPELAVTQVLDPPVERVDAVAFAAKAVAGLLHNRLAERGFACTRLGIYVETERGEQRGRIWRCAQPLTMANIADRVRWQLDGWLCARDIADRPSSSLTMLRLVPEEIVDGRALQLGLWNGKDAEVSAERAGRAFGRVQGLLGPDGVCTAVLGGGRGPADQVNLVAWGDERIPVADPGPAWPGRLPAPFPATVPIDPPKATVFDGKGREIGVSGRHRLTGVPHRVSVADGVCRAVLGWAGPWPVVEQWWDPGGGRRRARMQVMLAQPAPRVNPAGSEPPALLLVRESGQWLVEGIYD